MTRIVWTFLFAFVALTATAAPVRMATEPWVLNKVGDATNSVLAEAKAYADSKGVDTNGVFGIIALYDSTNIVPRLDAKADISSLAVVATNGEYSALSGRPVPVAPASTIGNGFFADAKETAKIIAQTVIEYSAHYLTPTADPNVQFSSRSNLLEATEFFYAGEPHTPDNNDFAIVASDETHEGKPSRYSFSGEGEEGEWGYQYTFPDGVDADSVLQLIEGSFVGGTNAVGWAVAATRTNSMDIATNTANIARLESNIAGLESNVARLDITVPSVANAATNYTDSATNGLLRVETDPTIILSNRTLTVHGQNIEIPDVSGWSLDPVTNTVDIAIGQNAVSDSAGVAIGNGADARDNDPTSVQSCVAIGNGAMSHGGFSVALGSGAEAWKCGTVVGQASWAHEWGLALGKSAFAINNESMVLNALVGLTYAQSPSNCHKDHGTNTVNIWCTDDPNRIYFNNKTLATMMSEASVEFDPTDPAFSNAVLQVALGGIDTSEFPFGTAATVGGLLAALVAAYVALKKRADELDEKLAMVKQALELVNGEDSSGVTVLYAEDGQLASDTDSIEEV